VVVVDEDIGTPGLGSTILQTGTMLALIVAA
jgi:hypothetical protein